MYASGNTTVYKVTNATGGCGFAPTNPSPQLSLTPAAITPNQRPGKRGAKAQKKLRRQLDRLAAQLQRLRGGKIAAALDDTLLAAARGAKSALF